MCVYVCEFVVVRLPVTPANVWMRCSLCHLAHTCLCLTLCTQQMKSDFTVSRILLASTTRTFNMAKAAADFGYKPEVSLADGLQRTLDSFPHLRLGAVVDAGNKKAA